MGHRPLRAALETLGCRVNFSESDRLRGMLAAAGYRLVAFDEQADVYVVNTCTVTHVADRKSRQLLRRAVRRNPDALVVAVGCYADIAPAALLELGGVDLVLDQSEEPFLVQRVAAALQARGQGDVAASLSPQGVGGQEQSTAGLLPASPSRALIKVQDGCDNRCAYCIVSIARGPSRSRPAEEILAEVRAVERAGFPEVILTGINLGVYNDTHTGGLPALARRILQETGIGRLRFSSIEPQDFPLALLDLYPQERLCRHFHLPLQSGCDATLARMGRRYRVEEYRALADRIRSRVPDVGLTTDVIVGFPGETSDEFAASTVAIASLPFSDLHVFPFSPRPGTSAAVMPGAVGAAVLHERCLTMHQLAEEMARAFRRPFLGRELAVLWEGHCAQGWTGLSDNYLRVVTKCPADLSARVTRTRMTGLEGTTLLGQPRDEVTAVPAHCETGQIRDFVV